MGHNVVVEGKWEFQQCQLPNQCPSVQPTTSTIAWISLLVYRWRKVVHKVHLHIYGLFLKPIYV